MRTAVAALAVLVLAACGESRPAVEDRPDIEVVADALEATRERGTARYVAEATTTYGEGYVIVRRAGSYDLPRERAEQTQTIALSPDLMSVVGADVLPFDQASRTVVAGDTGYVQVELSPPALREKWLRHPLAEPGFDEELRHAETTVWPRPLDMLKSVGKGSREGTGDTAYVTVPAAAAFLAFPSVTSRMMVGAGLDVAKLTGTVDVEVTIRDGVVASVSYDALDAFVQAWKLTETYEGGNSLVTGLAVTLTLSDHGAPVTVTPPASSLTLAEVKRAQGR